MSVIRLTEESLELMSEEQISKIFEDIFFKKQDVRDEVFSKEFLNFCRYAEYRSEDEIENFIATLDESNSYNL